MGNHFHLLVKMFPDYKFTDEDIKNVMWAFMAMTERLNMAKFHLCVKNYQIFLSLSVK